jgi:hypothetical protein
MALKSAWSCLRFDGLDCKSGPSRIEKRTTNDERPTTVLYE